MKIASKNKCTALETNMDSNGLDIFDKDISTMPQQQACMLCNNDIGSLGDMLVLTAKM